MAEPQTTGGLSAASSKSTALLYLSYLEKLYEDNKCHYSISVAKLRELLNEIRTGQRPDTHHWNTIL